MVQATGTFSVPFDLKKKNSKPTHWLIEIHHQTCKWTAAPLTEYSSGHFDMFAICSSRTMQYNIWSNTTIFSVMFLFTDRHETGCILAELAANEVVKQAGSWLLMLLLGRVETKTRCCKRPNGDYCAGHCMAAPFALAGCPLPAMSLITLEWTRT